MRFVQRNDCQIQCNNLQSIKTIDNFAKHHLSSSPRDLFILKIWFNFEYQDHLNQVNDIILLLMESKKQIKNTALDLSLQTTQEKKKRCKR